MTKLTDSEIIKMLGGITVVARMLDIKPPSVHAWLKDGIPDSRLVALASQIELKSGGRFSRKLRWPEKFSIYWPELAQALANTVPVATESIAKPIVPKLKASEPAPASLQPRVAPRRHDEKPPPYAHTDIDRRGADDLTEHERRAKAQAATQTVAS